EPPTADRERTIDTARQRRHHKDRNIYKRRDRTHHRVASDVSVCSMVYCGDQPNACTVALQSSRKSPSNLLAASDPISWVISHFTLFSWPRKIAGERPRIILSSEMISASVYGCASAHNQVPPAAAGWERQTAISSSRFGSAIMSRRFFSEAIGNGIRLSASRCNRAKFPFASDP